MVFVDLIFSHDQCRHLLHGCGRLPTSSALLQYVSAQPSLEGACHRRERHPLLNLKFSNELELKPGRSAQAVVLCGVFGGHPVIGGGGRVSLSCELHVRRVVLTLTQTTHHTRQLTRHHSGGQGLAIAVPAHSLMIVIASQCSNSSHTPCSPMFSHAHTHAHHQVAGLPSADKMAPAARRRPISWLHHARF